MKNKYVFCVLLVVGQLLFSAQLYSIPQLGHPREFPSSVDNSLLKYFPPIINQKGGSCAQASGIGYMFTYEINRLKDVDAKLEENQYSYLYTWNFLNEGNGEGGFVDSGLLIAQRLGVMTEKDYGYSSAYQYKWASGYEKYYNAVHNRVKDILTFKAVSEDDIITIKEYLASKDDSFGGILCFSLYTKGWDMLSNYSGPSLTGYKSLLRSVGNDGAHALTIVGYDDLVESYDSDDKLSKGAFIVVNSWGETAHDRGRFYLPYHLFTNRIQEAGQVKNLSDEVTGINVQIHEPKIMFRIQLEYSSRDDLNISMMGKDGDKEYQKSSFVFNNNGGDYPMCGSYGVASVFECGLEFYETPMTEYKLCITRSERGKLSGSGKLLHFSVVDYNNDPPMEYHCPLEAHGVDLKLGKNIFEISERGSIYVSASRMNWKTGPYLPLNKTFIIRSAEGKYYKMLPTKFERSSGKARIVYKPLK